jgi:hypothetical protein
MYAVTNQAMTAAETWVRARGIVRYPEPAVEVIDPRFGAVQPGQRRHRTAGDGRALVRRPGLVWRRPLPAVE